MATLRHEVLVAAGADEVWKTVGDPAELASWMPVVESAEVVGDRRNLTLIGGLHVEERIVTSDPQLRRFQYSIVGGDIPVRSHLGTVDVIPVGERTLVVYAADLEPAEVADIVGAGIAEALSELASRYHHDSSDQHGGHGQ